MFHLYFPPARIFPVGCNWCNVNSNGALVNWTFTKEWAAYYAQ